MRFRYSGALACLLALAGIPAGAAVGSAVGSPAEVKAHGTSVVHPKHCRLLPESAQHAPVSGRRAQYAAAHGTGATLTVILPRTTCNTGR